MTTEPKPKYHTMNHIPSTGLKASNLATGIERAAEIPRRMADIDASLSALQGRIESIGIKISPALTESVPSDPSLMQATLPPSTSQIEASLYNFNQRIESMIDDVNRLIGRCAL